MNDLTLLRDLQIVMHGVCHSPQRDVESRSSLNRPKSSQRTSRSPFGKSTASRQKLRWGSLALSILWMIREDIHELGPPLVHDVPVHVHQDGHRPVARSQEIHAIS